MGEYPTSCEEVLADLQKRHQSFIQEGWEPVPVGEDAVVHRFVRQQDVDLNTGKPFKSCFSNYGLSVLVESPDYPLDIGKEVQESNLFVGAVSLNAKFVKELGYEIYIDPHPDPHRNEQHSNHAQIVCKKTQGKTKRMREECIWSVHPCLKDTDERAVN